MNLAVKRESLQGGWPWELITVPADQVDEKINELSADPDVILIERDSAVSAPKPITPRTTQSMTVSNWIPGSPHYNDPMYKEQGIFKDRRGTKMRLTEALTRSNSDRKVRVGVLDGGFTASSDVLYSDGYSFSAPRGPAYINGEAGLCDDEANPSFHGIWVAGVMAATPDNMIGMAGVAPNTELVVGRISDCGTSALNSDMVAGILWMSGISQYMIPTIPQVEVLNISFAGRGSCSGYLQDAINQATDLGVTIVIAAGNDYANADDYSPGNCDNVINVAASDNDGGISDDMSNTGSTVDIAATGEFVYTLTENDAATSVFGTSFAAPIVAGAITMIKAERPNLTTADFAEMLKHSGNPADNPRFGYGGGILDTMKFMDEAGIPRESLPVTNGVEGSREQYTAALLHPNTDQFLRNAPIEADSACDIIEIDGRSITEADPNAPLTLFKVAKGTPLNPTSRSAVIVASTTSDRAVAPSISQNDLSAWDYGISRCDLATGADCSQKTTIRAIDQSSLTKPAACTVASS